MLNLSDIHISLADYQNNYDSLKDVENQGKPIRKLRALAITVTIIVLFLFLPWTQSVRAPGNVNTLYPGQRPQTVQNRIPGRIEKWFVREGQLVQSGDTIIQISEVKDDYFDPNLIANTQSQIDAKKSAATNYLQKSEALQSQIQALTDGRVNKLEQTRNKFAQARLKVTSDSISYEAAKIDYQIAQQRLERMEEMHKTGLKSLTDLESRRLKSQETNAYLIGAENKLLTSKNELINARIELQAVNNDYAEKLGKARSELNSAQSSYFDSQGEIAKMENQLANYKVRQDNYFITAAQRGYVTKAISKGLGETIKEGSEIVSIMPESYDYAVELYIDPVDFPLIQKGNEVRLIFDGWPAIIFSGWPELSNGTFGGEVLAIDNFISTNGKYRLLVVPDEDTAEWPEDLRVGAGADGILLLKDVSLWYELWRQLNGFPPDYYRPMETMENKPATDKK